MPIIESANPDLKNLKGIHLWHAGLSTCSQRARIALDELGHEFESHIVDLHGGENASEEYQQIHPKGLVPAMVHDGTLIIESIDIIDYLDKNLGRRSLRPESESDAITELLQRADDFQPLLKVCTFEFLFRAAPPAAEDVIDAFQKNHRNEWLKEFHRDFRRGFGRDRINEAVDYSHKEFTHLNKLMSDGRPWLAGDQFSLADIAWIPNFHRYDIIGWPFGRYPSLNRWFKSASSRDSYRNALEAWEPQGLFDIALPKLEERRIAGDGIETYGCLSS